MLQAVTGRPLWDTSPTLGQRGESMSSNQQHFTRAQRVGIGSVALVLGLVLAVLLMAPATALGQTPGTTQTTVASPTTAGAPTNVPTPAVTLSTSNGLPGAQVTANGSGFQGGETVDVLMNGQNVGSPTVNNQGTFSLSF